MAEIYNLGDLVRVTCTFRTVASNALIDPTEVYLSVRDPSGTVTTYQYSVSGITKDSTGVYHRDIDVDDAGDWYYRWHSTGTGQAGRETKFIAREALAVSA